MDFELTEEQAALREVSRGMLAVSCPPAAGAVAGGAGQDVDDKLWQRGAELGWIGLAVPEEHDGAGQGLVELCLVAEELGRAAAPGAFLDSALIALALAGGAGRSWSARSPRATLRQAWPTTDRWPAPTTGTNSCSAAAPRRSRPRRRPTGCW